MVNPSPKAISMLTTALDVEAAFYDALGRADAQALMALWAEDEEIVCVHPGGPRLIGYDLVYNAWKEVLSNGGLHIRVLSRSMMSNLSSAVHHVVEQVIVRENGKDHLVNVAATHVFFKTPAGWRLVAHHASPAGQETAQLTQAALHSLH